MNQLEKFLLENGYEFATEKVLTEQAEPMDYHKVYADIKQLNNTMRHLGFQEHIAITIDFVDNKYIARVYAKKEKL